MNDSLHPQDTMFFGLLSAEDKIASECVVLYHYLK